MRLSLKIGAAGGILAAAVLWASLALAAPKFPALTGRVVDDAQILSPQAEGAIDAKLKGLGDQTGRQVVVVTLPSLQGLEIEDFGYQLGRAWGIGEAKTNTGALLIVAPKDRKVRIEVGYGLEPILTDALTSTILQAQVLPRFRAGDMEGGVVAGTDAIITQLALPADEAAARAKAAQAAKPKPSDAKSGLPVLLIILVLVFLFSRRGRGGGSVLPWILLGALGGDSRRGGGWNGGGGGGFGGGGFSGGGGSFGGGGSSGRW